MSLLYYNAIYGTVERARALMGASHKNFKLFDDYIKLAIDSQKRKKVKAKWRKVENGKEVLFTPHFSVVEIELDHTVGFKFENKWFQVKGDLSKINVNNPLIFVSQQKFVSISEVNIRIMDDSMFVTLEERPLENEIILWGSTQVTFSEFDINAGQIILKQKGNQSLYVKKSIVNEIDGGIEVTAAVKGNLNPSESLIFNGFEIMSWSIINSSNYTISNQEGEVLDIIQQIGSTFYLNGQVKKDSPLYINQMPVDYKITEWVKPQEVNINGYTCKILNENGKQKIYDSSITLSNEQVVCNPLHSALKYTMRVKEKEDDKNGIWIELIDNSDMDDSNYSTFSPIDYFFEDGVTELEDSPSIPFKNRKRFSIKARNQDERKIKLASTNYKNPRISHSDLPDELYIPINTYQLEKQKEAIESIKNRPLSEHQKLLGLTERKEQSHITWKNFQPKAVDEWKVLKDLSREGTEKQRAFVQKALATEDFVLLEGPPGSGKTTAIIELILQLIKQKKRILLSASTHVAIDNVLERLQEQNLMEGILPLRIGDDNNMSESVKDFSINRIERSPYRDIIIDSANLVCGTTIGILQHPHFKNSKGHDYPTLPQYDYLIIDESSKTTFQEFLVPALYAKRWVLVGDVRQLSPYTDREHLVANFETFINDKGTNVFSRNDQKASLLLFKYIYQRQTKLKYCIIESDEIISRMKMELITRAELNEFEPNKISTVAFLQKEISDTDIKNHKYFYTVTEAECNKGMPHSWILPTVDCLLIKQSELDLVKKYIPSNMLVLNRTDWQNESQFYKMDAFYTKNGTPTYQEKPGSKTIKEVDKIIQANNDFLKTKSWAEELVWRMVRIYELQYTNKPSSWLERDIHHLTPVYNSEYVIEKYDVVKDISLPSILESLKVGVGKRRENDRSTVLNSGFDPHVRKFRYEILDYQHRMHPEISEFPRQQFYNSDNALKDSSKLKRDWTYTRYSSRNIWIDVEGTVERNYNFDEAKRLVDEVRHFVNWAKNNPKADGTEWTIACLTFYRGQETKIRDLLRDYTKLPNKYSQFEKDKVKIVLYTVDKFQGRESDITFLSMVQTGRDGFMDNPNRLNVALTRAKYQRVVIGKRSYFLYRSASDQLKNLAASAVKMD
ncbi:AAA domain-containing protein [Bacillus sp. CGMCC 1.16607]|uniref:AAA domain-containing protein n=1 Tax=Bacillus sp. CGMCC 1.16607 TaxID=3351842 RepID=UPI003625EF55